jgi:hypothetical protein
MITFGEIVDWLGKQLDRLKTISIVLLVILFIIAVVNNGCQKQNALDLIERVTGLNVQNDILIKQNLELKRQQDSINSLVDSLEVAILDSEKIRTGLQRELQDVKEERDDLKDQILKVPTSTLYAELIEEIYPYPGEMKYPFNDPQVENIYYVSKDYELVKQENELLQDDISQCEIQLNISDSIQMQIKRASNVIQKEVLNGEDIILNLEEEINLSEDEIKRLKRQLKLRTIGAGAAVVAVIILAI